MSRYLLDATTCSHLMGNDPTVFARLDALTNVDYYFTIPIVCGEIQYGIERLETGRKRRELSERADCLLHEVPCEVIPREAGNYYARLKRQSEKQGTPLENNDLWIASTALVFDAILVTSDSDFRRLQGLFGLQLENWAISN